MYINRKTTGAELVDHFGKSVSKKDREGLVGAIDKLIKIATEESLNTEFERRLKSQAGPKGEKWYIPSGIRESISEIADKLPLTARAGLMQIGYEQVIELKKHFEGGVFSELKELLSKKLVDIYYDMPFDFDTLLDSIGELPGEKFMKLLKQNKISKSRAQAVLDEINKEYKVIKPDEEAATI